MKKDKKQAKYSLTKRIVGLTIFLDSLFLVVIVVIGLFVFSITTTNLKENAALTQSSSILSSSEQFIYEMENNAKLLSQSNDVIDYIHYINDGNDPLVISTDAIYSEYSRVLLLMESLSYITEMEKDYHRVFIASEETCATDTSGCMIDEDGQVFNDSNGFAFDQVPWVTQLAGQTEFFSQPYVDQITQDEVITYAIKVFNTSSEHIGYVGLTISLDDFGAHINELIGNDNDDVIILKNYDNQRSLVYFSDPILDQYLFESIDQYDNIDSEQGFAGQGLANVIGSESEKIVQEEVFNNRYLVTYNEIEEFQLEVIILVYDSQLLPFEIILVIALAVVGLLITIIGYIINRSASRAMSPINNIIQSIEEIRNGNYSVKVDIQENNEIKDIGDAINIMSEEIDRQVTLVYESFAYDQLTGLKNKAAVVGDINRNLLKGDRKVAVCLLQIDNLKDIIIIKGQMMGDSLVKAIAKEITKIISKKEMLYSNGGNELIYIIPDFNNLTQVRDKVNRIIYRFKSPIEVNNIKSEIKLYAGIATYPSDDQNLDDLIKKCDVSIFKDKNSEKKQVIFYNDRISQEISYQAELSEQLTQALEKKEIYLNYQPLIDNKSEIYGFEALARWSSPVLGAISPDVFISNAEENYLIIPIGTWILKESCKMQVALRKIFDKEFVISVNVSLIQILQSDYVKVVKDIIKETDINPNYLTLELTESIFIKSSIALDDKIEQLHQIGVKFSLDDFGTGYASLSYLRNIAFDNLKIDKSFIDGILDAKKENRIVGTIIQLVHNLDMKVIAEGVEYLSQYEYLKQLSTDIFQGYLMSKPLDINEAVEFINQFYKVAKNKRIDVLAAKKQEG